MVTQTTGAMTDNSNPLASLAAINTFVGMLKGGTSSQTTQSNITPEGMNYLLTQILSGSQGLAPIASGEKTAGLYNSTGRTQMLNDLSVRAAGELAAKQAGTTTQNRTNPSISALPILAAFAGTKLLGPTVKTGMSKLGIPTFDEAAAKINEAIWGTGGPGGGTSAGYLSAADTAGGLNPMFGSAAAYDAAIATPAAASEIGGVNAMGDVGMGAGAAETGMASAAASEAGASAAMAEAGATTAEASMAAIEAGSTAAEGAGIAETLAEAAAIWVICTELESQKLLTKQEYLASAVHALDLHPTLLRGYHWWAVPFTQKLRKSKMLSKLVAPIAVARCRYLLGKLSILGWLTVAVGEPICHLIGFFVPEQNWQVLYGSD